MFKKFVSTIKLVFSRAPDTSTPEGRSKERYRRVGRTALTAMAARVINILTGLAIVPLTVGYLGPERYGLWMALASFVTFLTFTDMGLGIGLQNALAECFGRDDRKNAKSYVSSAMLVMVLVFLLLVGTAVFVLPIVPFDRLVKVESISARKELLPTVQAIFIAFGFGLPTGLILRIYNAYQEGYWGNIWLAVGRVVGFLAVLVCIWLKLGLPILVASIVGAPFVCLSVASIVVFKKRLWLRPSLGQATWTAMRRIFGTGTKAVFAQLAAALMRSGPALVIANRLDATAVTPFAITNKLLAMSGIILTTALLPLWPAYGEAAARGDWSWVTKTFRRTISLAVVTQIPFFIIMAVFGQAVIRLWVGRPEVVPGWGLLMAVNVWRLVVAWNLCAATLLNGLDHMIGQAIYGPFFVLLALVVGYLLVPMYGTVAVIWSIAGIAVVGTGIGCGLELWWVLHHRMKKPLPATPPPLQD